MSEFRYLALRLEVRDDTLVTRFQPSNRHGDIGDINNIDVATTSGFAIDSVRRDTIEFLVVLLQRWVDSIDAWTPASAELVGLLEVLGEHLFELLFSDSEVQERLTGNMNKLGSELEMLRIELEFTGRERDWLASLPWEYLRIPKHYNVPGAGQFVVSAQTELLVNRRLSFEGVEARPIETSGRIKVLLVGSSPTGGEEPLPRVTFDRVLTALKGLGTAVDVNEDLIETPPKDLLTTPYVWRVTQEAFEKKVKAFEPHIIHFVGHGRRANKQGELAFADDVNGEPDWMSDREFAKIVAANRQTKLVFLQACQSALPDPYVGLSGVARQVAARRIPAVIGMQYRVESMIASEFAAAFYKALADREPVDVAVQRGRLRVMKVERKATNDTAKTFAFGLPVLYLRTYKSLLADLPEAPPIVQRAQQEVRMAAAVAPAKCLNCGKVSNSPGAWCGTCARRVRCDNCKAPVDALDDKFCSNCRVPYPDASLAESQFETPQAGGVRYESPPPRSAGGMPTPASTTHRNQA